MYQEQVILLAPRATAFTAVCDRCLGDDGSTEAFLGARVSGTLRLEASHGGCLCSRGHDIRVERANPALVHAVR